MNGVNTRSTKRQQNDPHSRYRSGDDNSSVKAASLANVKQNPFRMFRKISSKIMQSIRFLERTQNASKGNNTSKKWLKLNKRKNRKFLPMKMKRFKKSSSAPPKDTRIFIGTAVGSRGTEKAPLKGTRILIGTAVGSRGTKKAPLKDNRTLIGTAVGIRG